MQAGTCLLPRVSCDVAVMWHISLPSRSPSFEVSAIFPFCEIDDIFAYRKDRPYEVCIISIFLSMAYTHRGILEVLEVIVCIGLQVI